MKEMTEKDALFRLTAMCSQGEHCEWEMREKMRRWAIPDDAQARIMQQLIEEKYIDEARYCQFFVCDKIRFNKWGRRKVEQALMAKHIPRGTYLPVLDEVPDEDYLVVLRPLLQAKKRQFAGLTDYERTGRLIRFAAGRGFTFDIIRQCIDTGDYSEEEDG